MDHRAGQPAHGAGNRQPAVETPLRHRPRRDPERPWRQRRPPHPPGVARLAGCGTGFVRLVAQADSPADPHLPHLAAIEPAAQGGARRRWRQPVAVALRATPARGGGHSRQHPAGRRHARLTNGRAGLQRIQGRGGKRTPLSSQDRVRPRRLAPDAVHGQGAAGAGGDLRRVRLPRLQPDRAEPQPLDHPAAVVEPAQQPVRAATGRAVGQAAPARGGCRPGRAGDARLATGAWPQADPR